MQDWIARIAERSGPIFLAVADVLEAAIAAGEIRKGERLPTHRALADALGVDLTTITRAYAEARRRGLLQGAVGRGTFVRGNAAAPTVMPAPPRGIDLVDLSMNLPPLPAVPALARLIPEGLTRLLAAPDGAMALTYHQGAGIADASAAASWLMPTLGAVEPGRILVSPGAQPALLAILSTIAAAGDTVLTDPATYPGIRAAAAQLGIGLMGIAADAEGLLPDALDAGCRESRVKALYCIPTIHNPTTATLSPTRRRQLAAVARRHGVMIIEDDAYGLLPAEPLAAIAALAPDITFHVATVSKLLSPALRIAFVIAPDAAAARLAAALRANTFMASPLLSGLVAGWIREGTAAAILAAIRAEAAARQRLAREILPEGSFDAHPEGLHLWLRLPAHRDRHGFTAQMREGGLALVPSDAFVVDGPAPQAIRIALGAASDRDGLRLALQAVATAYDQPGGMPFADIV